MKQTFKLFSLAIIFSLLVSAVGLPLTPARAAGGWENVGPVGFSAGNVSMTSLVFNNGTPYVAFGDGANGSKASVMKFDAVSGNWVNVGPAGFSAGQASSTSLAFDGSTPYVAYRDVANESKVSVMKFDGTNWVNTGAAGFSTGEADYISLAVDNGIPYVAYRDVANGFESSVMKFNGTAWVNVGPAAFSSGRADFLSLAFDNGTPYVAFVDWGGGFRRAAVMKFDALSGNWVYVGPAGFTTGQVNYTSLVFNNGTPFVAFSDGTNGSKASVMKFNGTNWVNVGTPGFSGGPSIYISLAFEGDIPYVAFQDENFKASVMKFDGTYWTNVGTPGFSAGVVHYTSLALDNGIPYVAYRDESNGSKATMMKFTGGFVPTCFPLVVTHTGHGMNPTASPTKSTGCPGGQYLAGAAIEFNGGLPDSGWQITGWTGTNNDSSRLWTNTLTMPANAHTVSINYVQEEYTLTITSVHGTVTKNPDKAAYHSGDVVQLTAVPDTDWVFVNWTGGATGMLNPISITMVGDRSITANFVQKGTDTWYVATSGSDDNSCSIPASPCANINIALGKASPGDTIYVAQGRYTKQLYDFLNQIVDIQTSVTILGGWNSTFTTQGSPSIIDGENVYSGVINSAPSVTLSGFIIENAGNGQVGILNGNNLTLDRISVINNNGSGVINSGTLVIQNTTISQNKGNGLDNSEGNAIVKNSTITNNQVDPLLSTTYGGGIRVMHGTVTISNSIIAGNSAPQAPDCYAYTANSFLISNGHNIIGTSTGCSITQTSDDQFNVDPLLLPLSSVGYQPLSPESPALNAGNDTNCTSVDQRGMPRPQGSHCDIGAYEAEYFSIRGNVRVADVTLSYVVGTPQSVISDSSGYYSIAVPIGWSGTVTPTKAGYTFDPVNRTYTDLQADQTDQNYTAEARNSADTTGVFRPSNGLLYLKNQNTTGFADVAINYGLGGDYPVVGDWDGNGTVTIGIYRNGKFYLRNTNSLGFADLVFAFGLPGDQPVAGDWDGDGVDTIGVYRSSTGQFLLRNSNDAGSAQMSFFLGNYGDVGIAGDWDGDGLDTTGVFRPSNGFLFLKNTNSTGYADIALNYGLPGDKPVTGDWDGNGTATIGVYRGNTFYLRNSNTIGFADIVFSLGNPGDMPIAGDWDGLP